MKQIVCSGSGRLLWPLPQGEARLDWQPREGHTELTVRLSYRGAWGMGEKYDTLNHKGCTVRNQVEEKFCFQGEHTYCPAPFFWTDSGFGLYAATDQVTEFTFADDQIRVQLPENGGAVLFAGEPETMIREYMGLFGPGQRQPSSAVGHWISANPRTRQAAL